MHINKPIIIALILFIIIILIFFLVFPKYKEFKVLQTELGIKKAEYNAEYEYYSEITQNYYNLQNNAEKIEKINNALPSESSLGKLVYYIQKQADKNGLILKSVFLTKAPSEGDDIKNIGFSLNLLGNYKALGSFLLSLERSARLFEIEGISFGSGTASSQEIETQFQSQDIFQFTMQITTHAY